MDDLLADLEQRVAALEVVGGEDTTTAARPPPLQFFPLSSRVDSEFWRQFGERKLNQYKLSADAIKIESAFITSTTNHNNDNEDDDDGKAWLEVRADESPPFAHEYRVTGGRLVNYNTLEEFKAVDKVKLAEQELSSVLGALDNGSFFADPVRWLTRFVVISFADLKRHVFVYWFVFPALAILQVTEARRLPDGEVDFVVPGFFHALDATAPPPVFFFVDDSGRARGLEQWPEWRKTTQHQHAGQVAVVVVGFVDNSPNKSAPGWWLRNLLLACVHPAGLALGGKRVRVVCLRDPVLAVKRKTRHSTVWEMTLPPVQLSPPSQPLSVVGWEPNLAGQMKPRVVNLSQFLDKSKISEMAVDLNLKLMKWRAFPELDETSLGKQRVLVLGCGTLGCAVIRGLMGWGVKHLTLVDNGRVAPSNPVRQSLFQEEDVGKDKAIAARDRVLGIHSAMKVEAWSGSIPMPGHLATSSRDDVVKLDELVRACDVVFLLTDTRESRWLPTLLASAHGKLCLNAALDFDSFLVMRHGLHERQEEDAEAEEDEPLGCYFCSDVMAPRNSTRNRTLDQQCTVTRPGLAPVAGALLVEMLVALMHHPSGVRAPATSTTSSSTQRSKLGQGTVPHVIRGHLGAFSTEQSVSQSFPQCTACSLAVTRQYLEHGCGFVERVLADPDVLDEITGLDKLKQEFDAEEFWEEEEE